MGNIVANIGVVRGINVIVIAITVDFVNVDCYYCWCYRNWISYAC